MRALRNPIISAIAIAIAATACTPAQQEAWKAMSPQEREHYAAHLEGRQPYETASMGEDLPDVSGHWFLRCVRAHESDTAGSYRAQNPRSTASGAYQFLDSTWRNVSTKAGFPGYSRAIHAPPRVQDHVALWLYNSGGKSAWNGTGC